MDPSPDVVLLDLDGTLSEAGPAITAAVALALEQVGADPLDEAALRAFVGPPLEDSFAALPGMDEVLVERAVVAYRASYDLLGSSLYAGVQEALQALQAAGLRLALATSKPQPFAEQVVAAHALAPPLERVAGSDREAGQRTKGDVVAEALRQVRPARGAVMVGDRRARRPRGGRARRAVHRRALGLRRRGRADGRRGGGPGPQPSAPGGAAVRGLRPVSGPQPAPCDGPCGPGSGSR